MQKSQIFVVEWLNKLFSVVRIANNSAWTPQQDVDTDRILIDYLRPMVLEMYPKFNQEAIDLEFLFIPGHFASSVSTLTYF